MTPVTLAPLVIRAGTLSIVRLRLAQALEDWHHDRVLAVTAATTEATTGRERVERGFAEYFRFVAEHRAAFRLLFGASVRNDPEFAEIADRAVEQVSTLVTALIDIDASDDQRRVLAHAIVGMAEATSRTLAVVGELASRLVEHHELRITVGGPTEYDHAHWRPSTRQRLALDPVLQRV